MQAVGNDRYHALKTLSKKAEQAFQAWSEGLMPDDLYNERMRQIREAEAHIRADVAFFDAAKEAAR